MKLYEGSLQNGKETFSAFRQFYNLQIKKQSDCFTAFEVASILFFKKYGFYLYRSLDEYLHELFKINNGYRLLDHL